MILDVPGNLLLNDHLAAAMTADTLGVLMCDFGFVTESFRARLRFADLPGLLWFSDLPARFAAFPKLH